MENFCEFAARAAANVARVRAFARGNAVNLGRRQIDCSIHGGYFSQGVGNPTYGQEAWTGCDACETAYRAFCDQREQQEKDELQKAQISARIDAAGVPLRFRGKRLTDYRVSPGNADQASALAIAQEYVEQFKSLRRQGASLVLAGRPGTGKSMLAMAVLQELCHRGYSGQYTTCQGLILRIRATWGSEGEGREADVMSGFSTTPLLVLDEIGVQAGTDNEKALLFEILDTRYAEMLPTIFAANLNQKEFQAFVGDRIWDRLIECAKWVPFKWDSYRPTAKREMEQAVQARQHQAQPNEAPGKTTKPSDPDDWTRHVI